MGTTRRQFSAEFKREAVQQTKRPGNSIALVDRSVSPACRTSNRFGTPSGFSPYTGKLRTTFGQDDIYCGRATIEH
jgi:hypothetical protein